MRREPHVSLLLPLPLICACIGERAARAGVLLRVEHARAGGVDAVQVVTHARLRSATPYTDREIGSDRPQRLGRLFGEIKPRHEDHGGPGDPGFTHLPCRLGEQLPADRALAQPSVPANGDLRSVGRLLFLLISERRETNRRGHESLERPTDLPYPFFRADTQLARLVRLYGR